MKKLEDIYWSFQVKLSNFWYELKWFFRNIKRFIPVIWEYRPWEYSYALQLFIFGLKDISKSIENGPEVRYSANKKIAQISRLIELLEHYYELDPRVDYFPMTDENRNTWFEDITKKKEKLQKEIVNIIFGDSEKTFRKKYDAMLEKAESDEEFKQSLLDEAEDCDDILYIIRTKIQDGKILETWWD